MTIIYHEPEIIKNCPQCRARYLPQKLSEGWAIACPVVPHGHMAMGDTYESTIHNWNVYISFILRCATKDLEKKKDESLHE